MPAGGRRSRPRWRVLAWRIEAFVAALAIGCFRLLPIDAASALGGALARTIGPRLGVSRQARKNLRRALPEIDEAAADRIIKAMWDNLGRVVAEYPHLPAIRVYEAGGRVDIVGVEHWDALLAAGRTIIFVSAHYGNWEIAGIAAAQRGLSLVQVYRAANNPFIDQLVGGYRGGGSELLPKGAAAARGAIAALRGGRHLGMLVDQKMNDGIAVPFFGRDAMTAPAAAQLALRFDAAILPARVERLQGARFRMTLSPPIAIDRVADRHDETLAVMTRINREIEGWIRERPEMWMWLHRRWPD
ncbi:MAG: lauroyl acyltransferase [Rhodospirillales bacterium]|nr:lauroyl acyltransferase [Rhodospirillales bacterium]